MTRPTPISVWRGPRFREESNLRMRQFPESYASVRGGLLSPLLVVGGVGWVSEPAGVGNSDLVADAREVLAVAGLEGGFGPALFFDAHGGCEKLYVDITQQYCRERRRRK